MNTRAYVMQPLVLAVTAMVQVAFAAPLTECHETADYLVAATPAEDVGTDFLVRYKASGAAAGACDDVPAPGDLQIRNQDAEYLLALQGDLLILDSGTGPDPRGLIIWNLRQRQQVYSGSYSEATVGQGYMEFWQDSGIATAANCPQLKEWQDNGLGAAIETWVRLDFADLSLHPGTQTRCSARQ